MPLHLADDGQTVDHMPPFRGYRTVVKNFTSDRFTGQSFIVFLLLRLRVRLPARFNGIVFIIHHTPAPLTF